MTITQLMNCFEYFVQSGVISPEAELVIGEVSNTDWIKDYKVTAVTQEDVVVLTPKTA